MKKGFTLAEILITLGIIGVVAAITIPTLIQNSKKQESTARLKKFYSTIAQTIKLSEIDNGESTTWQKSKTIYDENNNVDYVENGNQAKAFFMKYFAPYIKYTQIDDTIVSVDDEGNKKVQNIQIHLPDSSSILLSNGGCMDIIYDINGKKNPNITGKDRFSFILCTLPNERKDRCGSEKRAFCTLYEGLNTMEDTRTNALQKCKNYPGYCAHLLQFDNWEFKEDYPYKL